MPTATPSQDRLTPAQTRSMIERSRWGRDRGRPKRLFFSRLTGSKAMADERIPISREGYEKLKADLDRMQNGEMIEVAKRIATAREMGDLSENAEYHAAREDQGMLQARVDSLKDKLGRAYFVDKNSLNTHSVVF